MLGRGEVGIIKVSVTEWGGYVDEAGKAYSPPLTPQVLGQRTWRDLGMTMGYGPFTPHPPQPPCPFSCPSCFPRY
jgi:hypothetical protein